MFIIITIVFIVFRRMIVCCCFPVSGKKENLSLLGLKPHGWWQRKKGQHQCAGFKECKSGRAAANKERSDTWGIAWYLLAIMDMDFFFHFYLDLYGVSCFVLYCVG